MDLSKKQVRQVVKELKKPEVTAELTAKVSEALKALRKERALAKEKRDRGMDI